MSREATPAEFVLYVRKLCDHDWTFEFSDDHSVWQRGRDQRQALQQMQAEIDPDFETWNDCCPANFRRTKT